MTDQEKRKKVIKGLECCMLSYKDGCDECPYIDKGMCQELLGEHALALLKAQCADAIPVEWLWSAQIKMVANPMFSLEQCIVVPTLISAWQKEQEGEG